MSQKPGIVITPLRPEQAADFLRFFDHERGAAFADNPQWAKCYCHYYQLPKSIRWASLSAPQNRTSMQARIEVGEMEGYLAYDGAEVVGWVNAQPRHKLPHCFARLGISPTPLACAPFEAAAIVCFVIAPTQRRRGIARAAVRRARIIRRARHQARRCLSIQVRRQRARRRSLPRPAADLPRCGVQRT
ncbi:MAG: hypothetical protein AUH79_05415 [Betaproteobacteria bacterium 13_1_40CM_4_64_4]|nr:MAG: hypothetical protein AUH79_05415 [Betaproteobacteria bacterium 13_1_40CM_4_64_4]